MRIKVTIGVCVKDSEKTVKEAINSILQQDFPHELMEVIFVDDGSRDKTRSIIESYASKMDMQVRMFHHEWKGLGISRNLVVNNARGDYIVWVDGDMIIPKDHVRKQVKFMEEESKVGIAKARYGILTEETLIGFLENISYVAVDFLHQGNCPSKTLGTGGSVYRTAAIRQAGGFDGNLSGVGEDMDAEDRVKKAGWLLYLGTPAVFFERRRESIKSIWSEGFWHGYGGHRLFKKNRKTLTLYKMTPLAGLIAGLWYATVAYRILRRKQVFLLPLQYLFKRMAWCSGFIQSQIYN